MMPKNLKWQIPWSPRLNEAQKSKSVFKIMMICVCYLKGTIQYESVALIQSTQSLFLQVFVKQNQISGKTRRICIMKMRLRKQDFR